MKKTLLTFGLISGAILSAMMLITIPFHAAIGFDRLEIIGYTSMLLAFLLIFFGVRSYRDNVAGGTVRFGPRAGGRRADRDRGVGVLRRDMAGRLLHARAGFHDDLSGAHARQGARRR